MKQSAKTLGVVALGAAFAAAAAGTASASTLPHFGPLTTVAAGTPVGIGKALPAAAHKSLTGKSLAGQQQEASDPVGSLLGGVPTGPVASNLSGAATLPGGLTG